MGKVAPGRGVLEKATCLPAPVLYALPGKAFLGTPAPGSVLGVGSCSLTRDNRKWGTDK